MLYHFLILRDGALSLAQSSTQFKMQQHINEVQGHLLRGDDVAWVLDRDVVEDVFPKMLLARPAAPVALVNGEVSDVRSRQLGLVHTAGSAAAAPRPRRPCLHWLQLGLHVNLVKGACPVKL